MSRQAKWVRSLLIIAMGALAMGSAVFDDAWAAEGTVVISQGIDTDFLDVQVSTTVAPLIVTTSMYDALLMRDKNLQLVPSLATSYRAVGDKIWEVKLRQGVKFHNGEPFDATAVKFSFERINRPDYRSFQKPWVSTIDRVEVLDPYTVRFHTRSPDPVMPARMTLMYQMPPKYTTEVGDAQVNLKPVGTGAFKFVEWVKNDRMVVEANDQHWSGPPKVRRVIWRPIPETQSRIAALQTGQADIIVNVPPDQIPALAGSKSFRIEKVLSSRTMYLGIAQIKGGPLADRRVRQAINHAVDVQGIIDSVLMKNGRRVNSEMSPVVWAYDPSIPFYEYNPKKAKELLAAAGYPQGLTVTLQGPIGRYLMDKDVAQAIAGQLSENGIKTTVKLMEWGSYVKSVFEHKTEDLFLLGFSLPSLDPNDWVWNLRSGLPISQYSDPKLDQLMDQARTEMNPDKRKQLYSQLLRFIRDEAPYLFLYQQMDIYGVSNRIKWTPRANEWISLTDISFP